jgi:hypothetical protein
MKLPTGGIAHPVIKRVIQTGSRATARACGATEKTAAEVHIEFFKKPTTGDHGNSP